ncbi:MAG: twin-arginine translocase TatA/TatE family subunit [Actinobacteria bacterium]|jgi:sec-independent protein translocase protein TatA|nr:twin-arginine translocase TatA/TatE family subunit [Actinomycetota bacterium]OPZ45772.1 MAG: Sec-independent protein translocase protein TatA [Actinobacteria bacterium ADurb.BinA094]
MPNLGAQELIIIALIILLLFGASRLPKLGKSMGQSIRGFKQGLNEEVADDDIVDTKRDAAAEPEDQSKAS